MASSMFVRARLGAQNVAFKLRCAYSGSPTSAVSQYPGIIESQEEYHFVTRLIPPTKVPEPPKHATTAPSGWAPPKGPSSDLPYTVRRSRMHNIPVYTDITHGNRHMTLIRKIEGDIWKLDTEIRDFLTQLTGKTPPTQVNEVNHTIRIKGYYDKELRAWLTEKGF
ncbi:large ribosomal subunit protein mL49 [Pelodytes ibericus]